MTSFYSREELMEIGFAQVGEEVLVSRKASIYGAGQMTLGSHVRIDDFCILSGSITIGSYVHISAYSALFAGAAGVTVQDFCSLSARSTVYAINDDYSGSALANPTVPQQYTNVAQAPVVFERHVLVGSGCLILPGVTIGMGTSVGALSLVKDDLEPFMIYLGVPARPIKKRSRNLLELEKKLLEEQDG